MLSYSCADDGELQIQLAKVAKGQSWLSALVGHTEIDLVAKEADDKDIMLQRFQRENPGFDFSGASFNGQVPDATKFMGGCAPNVAAPGTHTNSV